VTAGYRTAVIDYPGYSPRYSLEAAQAAGPFTLERLADEIAEVARALRREGEPVVLLGWAFGNRPVRMAAHRHPELARAVVVVSAGQQPGFTPDVKLALMAVFQGAPTVGMPMYAAAVRYSCLFSPEGAPPAPVPPELCCATDCTPAVQKLLGEAKRPSEPGDHAWVAAGGRPLLCIGGVADRIAPPRTAGHALLESLGSEQVRVVDIEGAAHMVPLEKPSETIAAIVRFLDEELAKEEAPPQPAGRHPSLKAAVSALLLSGALKEMVEADEARRHTGDEDEPEDDAERAHQF